MILVAETKSGAGFLLGGFMTDYSIISLSDVRRDYLSNCTTAMPIGGFIAWAALAIAAYILGDKLPSFAPFFTARICSHLRSYAVQQSPLQLR